METKTLDYVIRTMFEAGIPQDVTIGILHEMIENSSKYSNHDEIDNLLIERLDIDQYIALMNQFRTKN